MSDKLETTSNLVALEASGALELVIVSPDGTRERRLPPRGEILVGRDPAMTVYVPDTSVSRHHLTLVVDDVVFAIDQGGRNGTLVAGVKVAPGERVPVAPGAAIQIGSTTLVLRVASEGARETLSSGPVIVDPKMRRVYELIDTVAPAPISVLILGETGSGKEVIAATIHRRSPRAHRPMLRLNCAAIPSTVIESELFGYEKGAFTGAVQSKPGLLETAHESTLLLDEIGDAPLDVQAKLLRFLETGEVLRVGSLRPRTFDVRVLAATNRDLGAMIAAGTFRADLFYRLDGLTIEVPPLRERRVEVLQLAEAFAAAAAKKLGRPVPTLSTATRSALMVHRWPGNVRELRAVIDRAVVLAAGATEIEPQHLLLVQAQASPSPRAAALASARPTLAPPTESPPSDVKSEDLAAIQSALTETAGNQSRAAKLLGISRKTLLKRLERYDVPRPRKGR